MTVTAYLYDVEGRDREVKIDPETLHSVREGHLLWIDVDSRHEEELRPIAETLGIERATLRSLLRPDGQQIDNYGTYTHFAVHTAPGTLIDREANARDTAVHGGTRIDFLVCERWLLTVHIGKVAFIEAYREQDEAETTLGTLTPYDFAASLLDAHLEAYFEEIARIEAMIDRLDEQALVKPSSRTLLGRMVGLRRRVSRLRVLLSAQRGIFYGLSRPDLQTVSQSGASPHFQVLVGRFERAIDEVEHTRDLVVGSFELFATRTAQQTNDLVKVLTYLTAVVGICAAVAGIFGMNFETDFFASGDLGFYTTIGALIAVTVIATAVARWRRWI